MLSFKGLSACCGLFLFTTDKRQSYVEIENRRVACISLFFFFFWSRWMPSGHCNGWVSLYKKTFGWLVLFRVSALHSTLNPTVIVWLPQVKNKIQLISFSKSEKEQHCWCLLNGKKVQAARETDPGLVLRCRHSLPSCLPNNSENTCFVQSPLPALICSVHRKQAALGYLGSLCLA